jgi:hypothetical protein
MCQQLGVPVQAGWKACTLAARLFSSSWESLDEVAHLEKSLSLNYSVDSPLEQTVLGNREQVIGIS